MIEVSCPKCNRILMVYSDFLLFDDALPAKSVCCDEVFYISRETEAHYDARRLRERDNDVTIEVLEHKVEALKEALKKERHPVKHSWTKTSMPRCRKVFLESMIDAYWNLADEKNKKDKIFKLIEQYQEIERTVK